ncbi:MAG: aminotransferase class III-fold pyridoxal phosphate-dependent enzyme [Flavobacteriales bacterium]|nr:aminotransferase class III-fold pyridoxal phosphate-dependent enzyme [Flavobacteriales bacterium]MCB9449488.1 aminotransferase class III-fold pyridoxal phosphate-dependent enzyme [Flavobacteriales bacterium]
MKLFDVYPLFDINLVKGEGSWVWDDKGKKYLDLYGGHAVISIGHTHPHYVEKIASQLNRIGFYSNSVQNHLQGELADKLGVLSGCNSYALFLCNSGAEANENALKLASFHNGRKKVIAFSKGFHGRTSLAVAATDNPSIVAPVNADHQVTILPLNDDHALKQALEKRDVAAVIVEGIQGVGGVKAPTANFLRKIRALCDETGTQMILDEVQSGYGRSGKFFAFQYSDVKPDMITMAKGMGNGFPIAGVLVGPHIEAKHGMLGTTFGGNHLACAAGIAVLDVIKEENLLKHATEMGAYITEALGDVSGIKNILGRGLMIGLELDIPCADVRKSLLFEHGIFTGSSSNKNTIRILPALNLQKAEADLFITAIKEVLSKAFVS